MHLAQSVGYAQEGISGRPCFLTPKALPQSKANQGLLTVPFKRLLKLKA